MACHIPTHLGPKPKHCDPKPPEHHSHHDEDKHCGRKPKHHHKHHQHHGSKSKKHCH